MAKYKNKKKINIYLNYSLENHRIFYGMATMQWPLALTRSLYLFW